MNAARDVSTLRLGFAGLHCTARSGLTLPETAACTDGGEYAMSVLSEMSLASCRSQEFPSSKVL